MKILGEVIPGGERRAHTEAWRQEGHSGEWLKSVEEWWEINPGARQGCCQHPDPRGPWELQEELGNGSEEQWVAGEGLGTG